MKKIFWHLIIWLLFSTMILMSQREFFEGVSTFFYVFIQGMLLLNTLIVFYVTYLVLVPRFLIEKRRIGLFFLASLGLIVFAILFSSLTRIIFDTFNPDFFDVKDKDQGKVFINGIMTSLMFILISTGIRMTVEFRKNRLKQLKLKELARNAELSAIKAQINPHFLYNAFNSLYALSEKKSEHTSEAILQLSEIMRYITYKSTLPEVSIYEEISFIESYIEFQKLRLNDADKRVVFNLQKPTSDFKVYPLLLISFIENAFKHSNLLRSNSQIKIDFSPWKSGFKYSVINHIETNKLTHSGIGIKNLKKILNFIYPEQHQLNIQVKNNMYHAELYLDPHHD